ncbi:MAG: aspartate kinase [Clostridia bacterium]|nr:aspartate kinase [Clostridia bacterium]
MLKVVKFGGSSLASAEQFKKVAAIVKSDPARRYVVPSAPGKRFKDDIKVTDLLYKCYEKASKKESIDSVFNEIVKRYRDIAAGIGIDMDLDSEFANIRSAMLHRAGRDYAASRGEYLNALVLSKYLGYDFIDACDVIFFKDDGSYDPERTNRHLGKVLKQHKNAVIPGFYGAMPNDTIKTFSRGGGDISGSIVARAAQADLYENWTDVSGFLVADPRIVDDPRPISVVTYRELRELSYMGASVLHEESIFPVRIAGIPINVRNTNDPSAPGTMIVEKAGEDDNGSIITGIAGRKGFSSITLEKDRMNTEIGFGRKVLEVLENEGISFEQLPSGIDTMSVIIETASLKSKAARIVKQLQKETKADHISVDYDLALIAVVGRNMVAAKGTAARILGAIAKADVNVRMIDQGSSELNVIIAVEEKDFEKAIRAIYGEFNK